MNRPAKHKRPAAKPAATDVEAMYKENILDHYRHPHNFGRLFDPTFSRHEANFSCGDDVELFIKLDASGRVAEVGFAGQGCAISQAAISLLTDKIKGMKASQLKKLTADQAVELLGIPVGPGRIRCATLGWRALQNGLSDQEKKK